MFVDYSTSKDKRMSIDEIVLSGGKIVLNEIERDCETFVFD
jgi:hypothetical protein